jgi:murein L,D-transpeptidase YcbB/YkuD
MPAELFGFDAFAPREIARRVEATGVSKARLPLSMLALLALFAVAATAAEVSPRSIPHYQLLESAHARYAQLAADPTLTALPALPARSIRTGDTWEGAPALQRLLVAVGDLPAAAPAAADTLDATLTEALRRFQKRHDLADDGVLGPATWRALTTPLSRRARQIELTLQRWRELPPNPWQRAIFINIPQFRLFGLHSLDNPGEQTLVMNVVVGRTIERLRTPTFVADMTHLIFRPYWEVPHSIAVRELLPAIRARAAYLDENHLEVVSASGQVVQPTAENLAAVAGGTMRLRQRPGADNALGTVKFVLPNPHSVYLHDTPQRSLFSRSRRAFSHGCVRVADPQALAQFALQDDPAWTPERIAQAMTGSEPLRVDLREPVRVYIVYGTAVAKANGEVLFFEDVYGLEGP